ncbi:hypothetical protein O1611_g10516 [Lasiodiplodia mahajangana]|uniref:Uncharacterized protein n=1 Tax=Lasiodiplodia mahajangana TaxID=1108764 RepID=A0ACC2IXM9_9PEZI|nr:hypothetical protein O1611_g10516 [Lasiodiplodia mahajangana]
MPSVTHKKIPVKETVQDPSLDEGVTINPPMSREEFEARMRNPLFPAHWAMWVPSEADPHIGKRIHAEGDAATGFRLSFDRNYDIRLESRRYTTVTLAKVRADYVADTPGDGVNSADTEPRDAVETVAAKIPPPGRSLVSAAAGNRRTKVQIKNCQTWLIEVVNALHKQGILDSEAVEAINNAPKN